MKETDKMRYLEELFAAELPDYKHRYLPQLKKSIAKKLIEEGLAQEIEISDHNLRLTCHQLTHKGFWMYGEWSRTQEKCDCC